MAEERRGRERGATESTTLTYVGWSSKVVFCRFAEEEHGDGHLFGDCPLFLFLKKIRQVTGFPRCVVLTLAVGRVA